MIKTVQTGQRDRSILQRLQDLLLLILHRDFCAEDHGGVSNTAGLQNVELREILILVEMSSLSHASAMNSLRLQLPIHHAIGDLRNGVQSFLVSAHKHNGLLSSIRNAGSDVGCHFYHLCSNHDATRLIRDIGAAVDDAENTLDASCDHGTLLRIDLDVLLLRHSGLGEVCSLVDLRRRDGSIERIVDVSAGETMTADEERGDRRPIVVKWRDVDRGMLWNG